MLASARNEANNSLLRYSGLVLLHLPRGDSTQVASQLVIAVAVSDPLVAGLAHRHVVVILRAKKIATVIETMIAATVVAGIALVALRRTTGTAK